MNVRKEMLIAGNFTKQSFDLIPAKQKFKDDENLKHIEFFKPLTDKVSEKYPNIEFDYSRFPSLVLSDGGKTLAVLTHSDINQKKEHLKNFGCSAALFTDAFSNFKTLNMVKEILPIFGADFSDMNVREDLGKNQGICKEAIEALKNNSGDFVHCANLTHTFLTPLELAKNYMKVNNLDDGWISGDRDRVFSQEYQDLMKDNPSVFRFANKEHEDLGKKIESMFGQNADLVKNIVPMDADSVNQKTKLATDIEKTIKDQKTATDIEMEWLEKRMSELDLHFNLRKKQAYKDPRIPFVHDMTIHNRYNRELLSWRTGSGGVNIHDSAIHDENAGKLAAEIAYKKFGAGQVHFNISKKAMKRYSEEEIGIICEKKMNDLIEAGFEPEQIVLPSDWQYLVNMKIQEMKNSLSFEQATPEQVAESEKVMDGLKNKDVPEGQKQAHTEQVELPEAMTKQPSEVASAASKVASQAIPAPTQAGSSIVDQNEPAEAHNGVPNTEQAEKKKLVVNGCYLVENKDKNTWLLYGVNGSVKASTPETMKKIINKLAEHEGIEVSAIKGCWLTPEDKPLYTLAEIKKYEASITDGLNKTEQREALKEMRDKFSFKLAYDSIQEIKEDLARESLSKVQNQEQSKFETIDLDEPQSSQVQGLEGFEDDSFESAIDDLLNELESDPKDETQVYRVGFDDELPIRDIADVEREQAEALGIDLDSSDAYKELQAAREGSDDATSKDLDKSKDLDAIDNSSAIDAINNAFKQKAAASNISTGNTQKNNLFKP